MKHSLPEDLILYIQLKQPVKSLMRFKCVSKSWYCQISSPSFVEMYEKQAKKNPYLLIQDGNSSPNEEQSDDEVGNGGFTTDWFPMNIKTLSASDELITAMCQVYQVMVSCLGLICFLGSKNGKQTQIFLCNPTSSQVLALPMDSSTKLSHAPIKGFGIGCLSPTQYKVVMLFRRNYDFSESMKCEILEISSSTGGDGNGDNSNRNFSDWRLASDDCPNFAKDCTLPTFVDEHIYWKTNEPNSIISFNIKNEKFGTLTYPDPGQPSILGRKHIMDLEGKLGVAMALRINNCFTIRIWKLQQNSDSCCVWKQECTVPFGGIREVHLLNMRPVYVLDKEIIMYNEFSFVLYNAEKETMKTMDVELGTWPVGMFYESLFSLGTM